MVKSYRNKKQDNQEKEKRKLPKKEGEVNLFCISFL